MTGNKKRITKATEELSKATTSTPDTGKLMNWNPLRNGKNPFLSREDKLRVVRNQIKTLS